MDKNYKVTTGPLPLDTIDTEDSDLNLFDQTNPDINLFNSVDAELIKLSGSKIYYYMFFQDNSFDEVYGEYRNKVIIKEPMLVYGHYNPQVLEEDLSQFGITIKNEQIFIFNKSYIEQKIGRLPIPGDIIKPAFQNQKYQIHQVQEDSFEVYGVYHLNCYANLLRDYTDVQDTPLDKVSEDVGGYSGIEGEF